MKQKQIFTCAWLGLILLALSSCDSYQRNYPGPLRPLEEVAFLFNGDSTIHGQLGRAGTIKKTTLIHVTSIPDKFGGLTLGTQQPCRELLPGDYQLDLWKTTYEPYHVDERILHSESIIFEDLESWDDGPYHLQLEVRPGHIYLVDCQYNSRKWYEPASGLWELKIRDVTASPRFQNYVYKVKRK